jgi:hypothetical protein
MSAHAAEAAQQQDEAARQYIRSAGTAGSSAAEEIAHLADLRDKA